MPPTDPVFTQPAQGTPSSAASAAPAPSGNTQPAEGTPDLDTKISKAVSDALAPLVASQRSTEKFMGDVAGHLQNPPQEPVAAPEGEFWNRFTADPEGAIDGQFNKVAGPLIGQLASSQVKGQMERYRGEIDSQWGAGAFDTLIKDDLNSIVNRALQQNPAAVLNSEALETTRDALIGRKVAGLAEHKQKAQATQGDATATAIEAAVQAELQKRGYDQTTLSGGIRRVAPVGDKLPDDLHEYLAGKLRDTGQKLDEKRAARMMSVGRTLSEWEAADAELSK